MFAAWGCRVLADLGKCRVLADLGKCWVLWSGACDGDFYQTDQPRFPGKPAWGITEASGRFLIRFRGFNALLCRFVR